MKNITRDISVPYLNPTAVLGTVNLMVLSQHAEGYSRDNAFRDFIFKQTFCCKKRWKGIVILSIAFSMKIKS